MGRAVQLRRPRQRPGARVRPGQRRLLDRRVPPRRPAPRRHAEPLRRLRRPRPGGAGARARAAAKGRSVLLIAENEPQQSRLVRPLEQGGYGLDGLWNDDFHHTARVALTRRDEAYYGDYGGTPQEFLSALKWGYL